MKLVILLSLLFSFQGFGKELCSQTQNRAQANIDVSAQKSVVNTVIEQELIDAIKKNDLKKIKELLEDGVDPNLVHRGNSGNKEKPVLFVALEFERVEAFKMLLAYGADANVNKTADGVFDNNLLMVAFRRHARREGKGQLTKMIKILLDGEYEYENKTYKVNYDPYAIGGISNYRDVVSVIHKNGASAESLGLLYSHPKVNPKNFLHKRNYIVGSAIREEVEFLNLYLEFNADKVPARHAHKALEYLNEKFNKDEHQTEKLELIQRLSDIAYTN